MHVQFSCIYTSETNLARIPQGSCFVVLSTEMFLWPFLRSPRTPSGQWLNICLALLQRYPQWLYIFLSQADWCLCVSSLLLVLSLYIFIIKSTSINIPLCDTSSSVLHCNLRPSTDVNICLHWSTITLLPPALRQLPKRMRCTLGSDQKTSSYTQFSGFFCVLRVKCQLHNLNWSQLSFHNFLQVSLLW